MVCRSGRSAGWVVYKSDRASDRGSDKGVDKGRSRAECRDADHRSYRSGNRRSKNTWT